MTARDSSRRDWLDDPELQGAAVMLGLGCWMIVEAGRAVVGWALR